MCVSADNPAVTTVLELTEANCVPSNQNITVQIEARGSVAPQQYARDLAIAAVICFLGQNINRCREGKLVPPLVLILWYNSNCWHVGQLFCGTQTGLKSLRKVVLGRAVVA